VLDHLRERDRPQVKLIGYCDLATLVIASNAISTVVERTPMPLARFVQLITVPNGTCPLQPSSRASWLPRPA